MAVAATTIVCSRAMRRHPTVVSFRKRMSFHYLSWIYSVGGPDADLCTKQGANLIHASVELRGIEVL